MLLLGKAVSSNFAGSKDIPENALGVHYVPCLGTNLPLLRTVKKLAVWLIACSENPTIQHWHRQIKQMKRELTRIVEEEGVSRLTACDEPLEALHHILPRGPLIEVRVVVQQHSHVLLAEAKLGGEEESHAVGIINTPIQGAV